MRLLCWIHPIVNVYPTRQNRLAMIVGGSTMKNLKLGLGLIALRVPIL
jgi:hypothetical protein